MRLWIMTLLIVLSVPTFAQQLKKQTLKERKKHVHARIKFVDSHVKMLKACVNEAPSSIALDECYANSKKRITEYHKIGK